MYIFIAVGENDIGARCCWVEKFIRSKLGLPNTVIEYPTILHRCLSLFPMHFAAIFLFLCNFISIFCNNFYIYLSSRKLVQNTRSWIFPQGQTCHTLKICFKKRNWKLNYLDTWFAKEAPQIFHFQNFTKMFFPCS